MLEMRETAFEALYREHYAGLLRCAGTLLYRQGANYVSASGRAEEVVQETFAFAWERRQELMDSEDPKRWLYGVLGYKVKEFLRQDRLWSKRILQMSAVVERDSQRDFVLRTEMSDLLTQEEYCLLKSIYLDRRGYQELTEELGIKKSALAMRVNRIKKRFVKSWNGT